MVKELGNTPNTFFSLLPFKPSATLTLKRKKKRSYFQSSRNIWIVCPLLFMFLAVKFSESSNFQLHLVDNNSFPSQKTTRLKISSLSPAISQKEWVVFPCWSVILWTRAMKSKDNKWTSSCSGDMRLYVPNKKLVGWLWTIGENLTTVSPLFSRNPLTFSSASCLLLSVDADRN